MSNKQTTPIFTNPHSHKITSTSTSAVTMSNKQSSVEQLAEQIRFTNKEVYAELFGHIEQIKATHKEEIIKAWKMGDGEYDKTADEMSLDYYKETFEGGNK